MLIYDKPELVGLSRVVFLGFLFGGLGIASNAYLFKSLMVKQKAKIDIIALICSGTVGVTLALNGICLLRIGNTDNYLYRSRFITENVFCTVETYHPNRFSSFEINVRF